MDIYIVMKLAPFVYMILLNRILATNISVVGVTTSPGYSILSLPNFNLDLHFYFFSGWTLHTNFLVWYVLYFYESDRFSRVIYTPSNPIC